MRQLLSFTLHYIFFPWSNAVQSFLFFFLLLLTSLPLFLCAYLTLFSSLLFSSLFSLSASYYQLTILFSHPIITACRTLIFPFTAFASFSFAPSSLSLPTPFSAPFYSLYLSSSYQLTTLLFSAIFTNHQFEFPFVPPDSLSFTPSHSLLPLSYFVSFQPLHCDSSIISSPFHYSYQFSAVFILFHLLSCPLYFLSLNPSSSFNLPLSLQLLSTSLYFLIFSLSHLWTIYLPPLLHVTTSSSSPLQTLPDSPLQFNLIQMTSGLSYLLSVLSYTSIVHQVIFYPFFSSLTRFLMSLYKHWPTFPSFYFYFTFSWCPFLYALTFEH